MSKRTTTPTQALALAARRAERAERAAHDPYFGKRRKAGEHSGTTKASASRNACRDRRSWS